MTNEAKPSVRKCGPCTVCCNGWLRIKVRRATISPGKPCPHSGCKGCDIYEFRPEVCVKFKCAWLKDPRSIPIWMRPDKAKVIVRYITWGTEVPVLAAIPVGTKIPKKAIKFLQSASTQYGIPLVMFERFKENGGYKPIMSVTAYGPPGMEKVFEQIREQIKQIEYMGPM